MTYSDPKAVWPGWTTTRLIGRGSFGAVYEIEREVLDEKEKAALKVISIPQNSSDINALYADGYDDESITSTFKEYLKNIMAEYSLMRKLNGNTNVVNCDDVRYVQHDDGFGWDILIKMELLTPLADVLKKDIPEEQVVRIGEDICKALILCKKYNIIHRDIKPANIFVSSNGDYKLGDFGIAKTVEKTSGGTKIGTYDYMAPEVYHDEPYGSTADIYSLGMVLYWLLNERRTPFLKLPPALPTNSEKEQARKRRFSGENIPMPVHGSSELKRIVLKACAYDPQYRYQSAEEMLKDLNTLASNMQKEKEYKQAVLMLQSAVSLQDYTTLAAMFDKIGSYKDAREQAIYCREKADELAFAEKQEQLYILALNQLQNTETPQEYVAAAERLEQLGDYKDAKAQAVHCRRMAEELTRQRATGNAMPVLRKNDLVTNSEDGQSVNESDKKKKRSLMWIVIAASLLIGMICICYFSIHQWEPATCVSAEKCVICGATYGSALGHDYAAATCTSPQTCTRCGATYGSALGHNYTAATCTSPQTCTRCGAIGEAALDHNWNEATYDAPATCSRCGLTKGRRKYYSDNYQIGDIIIKGHYEQDNNTSNGKEAIEWIVIGKKEDSVLLLSRYCLDRITYGDRDDANNRWSYSSLRNWLNNTFIKQAFSESEIKHLSGAEDKVFCLSWEEYISITDEQIAYGHPTTYAKARGAEVFRDVFCPWWLRITTEEETTGSIIIWVDQDRNGILTTYWTALTNGGITVRPAVWYNLRK